MLLKPRKGTKNIKKFPKNAFKVNFFKKCKIKNTLKQSVSPNTHFILTNQRFKTSEKKHQNPSPSK